MIEINFFQRRISSSLAKCPIRFSHLPDTWLVRRISNARIQKRYGTYGHNTNFQPFSANHKVSCIIRTPQSWPKMAKNNRSCLESKSMTAIFPQTIDVSWSFYNPNAISVILWSEQSSRDENQQPPFSKITIDVLW